LLNKEILQRPVKEFAGLPLVGALEHIALGKADVVLKVDILKSDPTTNLVEGKLRPKCESRNSVSLIELRQTFVCQISKFVEKFVVEDQSVAAVLSNMVECFEPLR